MWVCGFVYMRGFVEFEVLGVKEGTGVKIKILTGLKFVFGRWRVWERRGGDSLPD